MITIDDIKRVKLPHLTVDQIRRLTNAEKTCKNAITDWSKGYWYNVFKKYVRSMMRWITSERLYTNEYFLLR